MLKKSLIIALTALVMGAYPIQVSASQMIEIMEMSDIERMAIDVQIEGNTLRITGAAGLSLCIYRVSGNPEKPVKIASDDEQIQLNLPKGMYIIKVGSVTRKITIK